MTEKTPQNPTAERAILCSIVKDPSIQSAIDRAWFFEPANIAIFDAAEEINREYRPTEIQFIALKLRLEKRKQLEDAGGVEYLNEVYAFIPTSKAWPMYRDALRETYRLRQAVIAARSVLASEDTEELSARLQDLKSAAEDAPRDPVPFSVLMGETIDWLSSRNEQRIKSVVKFGIPKLDSLLSPIEPGSQIVIGADTGRGKTALALQAVLNSAPERFAIFSLEMPSRSLVARMIASYGNINLTRLRKGKLHQEELDRFTPATELLSKREVWVDDTSPMDTARICSTCRSLKANGLSAVVVDYVQLVKCATNQKNISREREVADISRALKSLAVELGVVVIALSQLNDDGRLRESRAIGQDADIVLTISAGKENEPQRIYIDKHRNGCRGSVDVEFLGEYTRFDQVNS